MAHEGKIACHFPAAGNPNHDVYGIKFLPVGGNASNLLTIDKVYYLSASDVATMKAMSSDAERLAYLQSTNPTHRVWELIAKSLVAGTETIVFEYTPQSDVNLTSIGIFTDSNDTNTTCNVAIYHESGLVVYKHNADTIDSIVTKYELQGRRRHIDGISGVTLKGGLKYYIQYTQETDSNHTTFYPAYFSGTAGNYKVWYHGSVQNKQTVNMANFNRYWGLLDDNSRIFGMDQGDFFIWNGSSNVGMTVGNCYVRSNVGAGQGYVFRGVIGNPATYENVTSSDVEQLLAWPAKTEFIWYRNNYTSGNVTIKRDYVYAKSQDTSSIDTVELSDDTSDWKAKYNNMSLLLNEFKNHTEVLISKGYIYNNLLAGSICSLKSGYVIDSSFNPTTTDPTYPSNPIEGHIYCVYDQYNTYNLSIVYTSNGWKKVEESTQGDGIAYTDFMNAISFASFLTEVGKNSDFISETYDSYRIAASLRDNDTYPIQTGRKYYLEINDSEV